MKGMLATVAAVLFAMAFSLGASAESIKKSVTLPNAVEVNGKTLAAGDYKVKIDTNGNNAQVTFLKNGKEVASAAAEVKTLAVKPNGTRVQMDTASSTPRLQEIDFSGTTTAIRFASNTATAGE